MMVTARIYITYKALIIIFIPSSHIWKSHAPNNVLILKFSIFSMIILVLPFQNVQIKLTYVKLLNNCMLWIFWKVFGKLALPPCVLVEFHIFFYKVLILHIIIFHDIILILISQNGVVTSHMVAKICLSSTKNI
jgi:hypothetical protein